MKLKIQPTVNFTTVPQGRDLVIAKFADSKTLFFLALFAVLCVLCG